MAATDSTPSIPGVDGVGHNVPPLVVPSAL